MIADDRPKHRAQWSSGKVEQMFTGSDGEVRGARVRDEADSGKSSLNHFIQKLHSLEVADEAGENVAIVETRDLQVASIEQRPFRPRHISCNECRCDSTSAELTFV